MGELMRLPKPIYKAVPFIYIGAGLLTALQMTHPLAMVSGLLFTSAGLMVFKYRAW